MKNNQALKRETSIKNKLGMHARPASRIAQMAENAQSTVWICANEQKVDASSILDILALGAFKDTKIKLCIENEADAEILDQIVEFFESAFGEH